MPADPAFLRPTTAVSAGTVGSPAGQPPPYPAPTLVAALQAERARPCVSLLLTTAPASRMLPGDAARLEQLAREAARRLRAEGLEANLRPRLEEAVATATASATGRAMAVFVSPWRHEVVPLPVAVVDRVVVDPTFATRDLVRALHRTPRHVVLVMTASEAKLFDAVSGTLLPVPRGPFPLTREPADRDRGERGRQGGQPAGARRDADVVAFLRQVDRALGAHLRLHPAPVVLVGPERLLATYRGLSRYLLRLAGTVTGSYAWTSLPELSALIRPVLQEYLRSREAEALELVDRRTGQHRVVDGIQSAWLAARRENPEMLAVEESLFYPARLDDSGDLLIPATDVDHPDVIDDAVDELIEMVLQRGGWVALVRDGALAAHERVALTLRDR